MAEMEGMKITISADASQAIRTIQDFQNKFRSMANSINGTMMNANVNINQFTDSISDIGNVTQIAQLSKMNDTLKGMNFEQIKNFLETNKNNDVRKKLQEEAIKAVKRQEKLLEKNKKSWLAVGVASIAALVGIVKMSSLAQMWLSELTQIFSYFIDTALLPLAPLIEGILYVFWSLTDWFVGLPEPVQGAVGALGLLGIAFGAITAFIAWLTGATGISVITGAFNIVAGAIAGLAAIIGLPVEAVIVIIAAVGVALYLLWKNWDEVIAWLGKAWELLKTKISDIWEGIKTYLSGVWDSLKSAVSNAWDYIKSTIVGAIQGAYDTIVKIVDKIKNAITSVPRVQSAINIATNAYKSAKSYLGYQQGTDYVPATGLYKLHEGEKVIPKGGSNTENNQSVVFNNTFNINNPNIGSSVDIRNLATQLSNFWRDDMTRYVRGVI